MPAPEVILWQKIRHKQLGAKFRRQYVIAIPHLNLPPSSKEEGRKKHRILDFYAPRIKLGIEIDGQSHFTDELGRQKETNNDQRLKIQEVRILRFLNTEIMKNLQGVLLKIKQEIDQSLN